MGNEASGSGGGQGGEFFAIKPTGERIDPDAEGILHCAPEDTVYSLSGGGSGRRFAGRLNFDDDPEINVRRTTYVTDPFPTDDGESCEFKLFPTPDETVACENAAVAVLTAPCCGTTTRMCNDCLGQCPGLASWLCLGCGRTLECRSTPVEFGIRWL